MCYEQLKILKYDQRVLQTQKSKRGIGLKSTPVILTNRVLQYRTMIGYFTSTVEARAPLGGMWTGLWSPKGVHVVVRRAPLFPP